MAIRKLLRLFVFHFIKIEMTRLIPQPKIVVASTTVKV
jgi:hypothetical protein